MGTHNMFMEEFRKSSHYYHQILFFITFLTMNYLFFAVKENPVITHSFLQMDCFHALINDVIL